MLTPSERWSWTYCEKRDRLLLDINEQLQFCSELSAQQLAEKPVAKAFSIAEAGAYWSFLESLAALNLNEAQTLELCLHALAAGYAQPTGHKSWYFAEQAPCKTVEYQLVQLSGLHSAIPALVLQVDGDSVICMLLTAGDSLGGKQLKRCSVVRVLSNRLQLIPSPHYLAQTA